MSPRLLAETGTRRVAAAIRTLSASSSSGIPSGILTPTAPCSFSRSSTIKRACSGKTIRGLSLDADPFNLVYPHHLDDASYLPGRISKDDLAVHA
jgi:hypothetical protein